ncbi:hypothetical protein [Jannaschia sp. CCS1]|uniref:hypothetical protein n=1 Tax=Jannaschia sp. (strain CCS1) TaxID=290400 RepID=UPI000053C39B|nr:hypothetical protein [Jannaschia sp. CCS1]ABD57144.1 hypothetical protein Jann_4228 [Jannaschia sp. CCS1]
MSWRIADHPAGDLQITHLVAARWTTGEFPIEVVTEGAFFWTDEGGGPEDAIHLYDFVWQDGAPGEAQLPALMALVAIAIEQHILKGV